MKNRAAMMASPVPGGRATARPERGARSFLFLTVFLLLSLVAYLTWLFSSKCPEPYMVSGQGGGGGGDDGGGVDRLAIFKGWG